MKKFLIPTCLVLCLMGIFAVWYFGHESTDPEKLKNESKDSLLIENHLQEESSVPETTQKTDGGDTAGEIETIRDDSNSEKVNAAGGTAKKAILEGEKEHQRLPSAEDIAAANAFEAYVKAETEFDLSTESLKEALGTRPLNWDHIKSLTSDHKDAGLRRKEALRNLAPYSEAAAEILAADKVRTAADEARVAQIKAEIRTDEQKRSAEWVEWYNRISPKQQQTLLDTFPELREFLRED